MMIPLDEGRKRAAHCVVRGGSWINDARNARSAYRNANHPGNANDNLGFRLCLSSMEQNRGEPRAFMDQTLVQITAVNRVP